MNKWNTLEAISDRVGGVCLLGGEARLTPLLWSCWLYSTRPSGWCLATCPFPGPVLQPLSLKGLFHQPVEKWDFFQWFQYLHDRRCLRHWAWSKDWPRFISVMDFTPDFAWCNPISLHLHVSPVPAARTELSSSLKRCKSNLLQGKSECSTD